MVLRSAQFSEYQLKKKIKLTVASLKNASYDSMSFEVV